VEPTKKERARGVSMIDTPQEEEERQEWEERVPGREWSR
jgi:hypothetical protein